MKKNISIIGIVVILAVAALMIWYFKATQKTSTTKTQSENNRTQTTQTSGKFTFANPKKSAHYENNTPDHGAVLASTPLNVVINFNFDLASPSEIKIEKDSKNYGVGKTQIDQNRLAMRQNMDLNAPDGLYTVNYNACWPDGSCHDGNFQFAVDRTKSSEFENLTSQKEVTIKLAKIMFEPQNIKISKGTKVTWINEDNVEHYVNTDSHPAHSYYPKQNSQVLKNGNTYSLTFETSGIYPYHCSAHAQQMIGSILVE